MAVTVKTNVGGDIHFSGGVLMTLLADARKTSRMPVTLHGHKMNLNEGSLFLAMIRLIRPMHNASNEATLRKQASMYKKCEISIRSDIPFHEDSYVHLLEKRISTDYYRLMEEAYTVLNTFIDLEDEKIREETAERIISALKEVIAEDKSIPDDARFPVQPDGGSLDKQELLNCTNFNFYSFVIGVFYFACSKVPNNEDGAATISSWVLSKGKNGKRTVIRKDIGSSFRKDLDISFFCPVFHEKAEPVIPCEPILSPNKIKVLGKYLDALHEAKYMVSTVMYNRVRVPLYNFYVSPKLRIRETDVIGAPSEYIEKPTPAKLRNYSRNLLLLADGGMGKTSLTTDLLLQAIKDFPSTGILPFFTELKHFSMPCNSIDEYLYEQTEAWWDHSFRAFTTHLERYQTIIFLDGFDEIKKRHRVDFAQLLQDFARRYPKAQIVISSRLVNNVVSMLRFRSVEVEPFSRDQCIELIKKYNYEPERPEVKAAFIKALEEGPLYTDNQQIAQNPLLCTMMLRVFDSEGRIPKTIARFYEQAYKILSSDHDAAKVFCRQLNTGLVPDELKMVLAELCMYAYSDECYSFTVDTMESYLSELLVFEEEGIKPVHAEALLTDLTENICLMTETVGGRYCFIGNRYFDNYFAAVSMKSLLKGNSQYAIDIFDRVQYGRDGDHVLDMLYDLDQRVTRNHLLLPKLEQIFDAIGKAWEKHVRLKEQNAKSLSAWEQSSLSDDKDRFCCFSYLCQNYTSISYSSGTVLYETSNYPISSLLNFILELNDFHKEASDEDICNPGNDFTDDTFYEYYDDEAEDYVIASAEEIKEMQDPEFPMLVDDEPFEDPDTGRCSITEVGRCYIIQLNHLDYHLHPEIIVSITDPSSPYREEYRALYSYYQALKQASMKYEGNVFCRPSRSKTA